MSIFNGFLRKLGYFSNDWVYHSPRKSMPLIIELTWTRPFPKNSQYLNILYTESFSDEISNQKLNS